MKYWDTSAILRAWKEDWQPTTGITRSHTVAEWVAVQTGRGLAYLQADGTWLMQSLSPADAAVEARRIFANLTFTDLTGEQVLEAIEVISKKSAINGPAVHDFMHARAAELHNATCIVTLNIKDFSRMTKLSLELPDRANP